MGRAKKAPGRLSDHKMIKVTLIPEYISEVDFQEKKKEIQDVITKILIMSQKRGRPSKSDEQENQNAA
jgi:hypothetical protein